MRTNQDSMLPPKSKKTKVFVILPVTVLVVVVGCVLGWFFLVDNSLSGKVPEPVSGSVLTADCRRSAGAGKMPITMGMLKKIKSSNNTFSVYTDVGPLVIKKGIPSCYQDSKAGATIAAINLVEGINTPSRLEIINQFFVGESVPKIRDMAKTENPANWSKQEDTHVLAYKTTVNGDVYKVEIFTSTDSGATHIYTLYMKFTNGDMHFLADESALVFKQDAIQIPPDFQHVVEI